MSEQCTNVCENHSGTMQRLVYIEKEITELKSAIDTQKGYLDGRLNSTVSDMKELRKELTDKMDIGFKKLEDKMDAKDKKGSDKILLIVGTILSPIIVIILQKVIENSMK